MFAVTPPGSNLLYFVTERPDEPGLIVVDDDARVEPLDFWTGSEWPEGTPRPDQVLCRSRTDPKLYKQFKYRSEVDPERFAEVGKAYGGTYDLAGYKRLRRRVAALEETRRAIAAMPDDPAETDEAWEEIFRAIGVDTGRNGVHPR